MNRAIISRVIPAVFMTVLSSTLAFSQSAVNTSEVLKKPPYAEKDKARELAINRLGRCGRPNMAIGELHDLGAIYVVKVVDRFKKGVLRNELFVRKDGAIMPVYGVPINGRSTGEQIENAGLARSLAGIWLWRTGQSTLQVGTAQETDLTYVVNLHPKGKPAVLANQLIIRKDGLLLPVGNGKTAMMLCIGCGGPGGGSFGWDDEFMLPQFPTDPGGWFGGWGQDWDTGWWGSGWGWGWGSSDSWTPPANQGSDDCDGMDETQCYCLRKCRSECRDADPKSNCFENCVDNCLLGNT